MTNEKKHTPRRDSGKGEHSGAHPTPDGSTVKSRSVDPGQSSYGGFSNEDPRRQEQQIDRNQDESAQKGEDIERSIAGNTGKR